MASFSWLQGRSAAVDEFAGETVGSRGQAARLPSPDISRVEVQIDHGDRTMTSPTSGMRTQLRLCVALGVAVILVVNAPRIVDAQGLVKGVEQGAREGNKAAGPV